MKTELYEEMYNRKDGFSFGKNWQRFLNTLTSEKIQEAEKSLVDFFGEDFDFKGKSFVDIGSGSGLFSLAAFNLGAHVTSVDIDKFSLLCTQTLKEKYGDEERWTILAGSALDKEFMGHLGTFDIIYSWGVLHHTGSMYEAIDNTLSLGKSGTYFFLAIYNTSKKLLEGTSTFWYYTKQIYNKSPLLVKFLLEKTYALYILLGVAFHGKNPLLYVKNYKTLRGMDFMTDIRDWLGGFPYEHSTPKEMIDYLAKNEYTLSKVNSVRSIGCNEFLFKKK